MNKKNKTVFIFFLSIFILFIVQISLRLSITYRKVNFSDEYLNSGVNYTRGLTGFEKLPTVILKSNKKITENEDKFIDVRMKCHFGYYLGQKNEPVSCASICNDSNSEFQYRFFPTETIINKSLFFGAYCMPSEAAACNPYLGKIIYTDNRYICISRYPDLFGGVGCNLITGCNGLIIDRLTNKIYKDVVPNTFRIENVDEKLNDGNYRIACAENFDAKTNPLIPLNNGSRFEFISNMCASLIYNAPTQVQPDYSTGNCFCGSSGLSHFKNNSKLPCTACVSRWKGTDVNVRGAEFAYSIARPCIDKDTPNSLIKILKIPCAFETINNSMKNSCERAILLATNTYSPLALDNIINKRHETL